MWGVFLWELTFSLVVLDFLKFVVDFGEFDGLDGICAGDTVESDAGEDIVGLHEDFIHYPVSLAVGFGTFIFRGEDFAFPTVL